MKRVIKRKLYDTDTAIEIGSWDNGRYVQDINAIEEVLYRKRTGEYFLYGSGGPNTRYAKRSDATWIGGSELIPLSFDAAKIWAEEHLSPEEYAKAFTIPTNDDGKIATTITLPKIKAIALRRAAEKEGVSISKYIENLISPEGDVV